VTIATDKFTYKHGEKVNFTVAPSDDFGVREVAIFDGPWRVATITEKPYRGSYTIPGDVTCVQRTLTAVATDSGGQTGSSATTIEVDPGDCDGIPTPEPTATATATASATATATATTSPVATATATVVVGGTVTPEPEPVVKAVSAAAAPSVSFGSVPASIASAGVIVNVSAVAQAGVRQLDVFLGTRKVCTLTRAPFTCRIKPTGTDVGKQSLRVVVTDLNGASAESKRDVVVLQFAAKGLTLSAKTKGSRTAISGKLRLPSQVGMLEGCRSGSVTLVVKRGKRVIDNSQVRLSRTCGFKKTITSRAKGKVSVSARFGGNRVLAPVRANRRFS
jgi:hypothetical protein